MPRRWFILGAILALPVAVVLAHRTAPAVEPAPAPAIVAYTLDATASLDRAAMPIVPTPPGTLLTVPAHPSPPEHWFPFEFNGRTYYYILVGDRSANDPTADKPPRELAPYTLQGFDR